mgnify:CR=1 FL=1
MTRTLLQLTLLPLLCTIALAQQVAGQDEGEGRMYMSFYYAPPPAEVSRAAPVYQGLAMSLDHGQTWQTRGWLTSAVSAIGVSPDDADHLVLGTDYGVLHSTNAGEEWKLVSGPDMPPVIDIVFDGTVIWAATADGLFQSVDQGNSWRARNAGLTSANSSYVTGLHFMETSILISTGDGVYRSTDEGESWSPSGLQDLALRGIAVHPRFPEHMAAYSTEKGIWVSTDGGRSWTERNKGLRAPLVKAVVFDPRDRNTLIIGTQIIGVLRSSDLGQTWEQSSGGMTNFNVTTLAFDTISPDRVYAGAENGSFVSHNRGKSWQPFSVRLGYVSDIWIR